MAAWMLLATVAWAPIGALAVWAEEPSAPNRLDVRASRRPAAVQPLPNPETVKRDAEEAISELKARQQDEKGLQQSVPTPSPRPDLDYDVWSGIQSQRLNETLHGR